MRKIDALYDWLQLEINRLTDSETADNFAVSLVEPELTNFTNVTEEMRGYSADIATAKAARMHFVQWSDLQKCVELFKSQFPVFPGQVFNKLLLFIILSDKISQTTTPLDAEVIDESLFEFCSIHAELPLRCFSYENSRSFEDSVVVFYLDDLHEFQKDLNAQNISPRLLFHLLAAISQLSDVPQEHFALVKKLTGGIDRSAIEAFIRLNILMSGGMVHSPKKYSTPLALISRDSLAAGNVYHQWNEVLHVLSEYNSRDEILAKYLTLYHVFENLMLKLPIVELERQQGGRMFTIRDFKRLYQQVDVKEFDSLKRLFDKVLKLDVAPGRSFERHIIQRWRGLTPVNEIEDAANKLGIKKSARFVFNDFTSNSECIKYFTSMVYQIRCAIVHNKETEFHLTHANFNNGFVSLIEKFLIPSLEELCFFLISSPNQHVWYSHKALLLYQ